MANASSKRIASSNAAVLKGLQRNMLVVNLLAFAVRWMKHRFNHRALLPRSWGLFLQIVSLVAEVAIWRWFVAIGTPRRDASGNVRVGENLSIGSGVIEMGWDVIYMTWICTLGSALLGNWVWWLFMFVPAFGGWKAYGVIQPILAMFLPGIFGARSAAAPGAAAAAAAEEPTESKRQAKLRARMDKGDKRVQAMNVRRT